MNRTFLQIAFKNLTRNRRRSLFTLGAIFFGIAIVIILKGVADGFLNMTVESVVKSRIGAVQVHKKGFMENLAGNPVGLNFAFPPELEQKILAIDHVTGVAPRVNFSGTISNGKNQTIVFGTGVKPSAELRVCPQAPSIIMNGRALTDEDSSHIVIGTELASSLDLNASSLTGSATDSPSVSPSDSMPDSSESLSSVTLSGASPEGRQNAVDATVTGTAAALNALAELRFVTVPLALAQDLTGLENRVTELALSVDRMENISEVKSKLQGLLGDEFEVIDWQEAQPFIRDVVFRQKVIIGIVSVVLFVLVMFLVGNTMLMTVHERTKEIGTMLAIGVTQGQILVIFILEAFTLGLLGGVLGAALGILANFVMSIRGVEFTAVFQKTLLYPEVSSGFAIGSIVAACICTVLAGLLPALKASNLNPVDALRS